MTQPTDRLGQPLSVGDWVEFNDQNPDPAGVGNKYNGQRYQVSSFYDEYVFDRHFGEVRLTTIIELDDRGLCVGRDLTKINHKPETTTWDKCVFVPESVQTAN